MSDMREELEELEVQNYEERFFVPTMLSKTCYQKTE